MHTSIRDRLNRQSVTATRSYFVGTTVLAGVGVMVTAVGGRSAACTAGEILSAFASNWLTCQS
jgi:hypothetical protein